MKLKILALALMTFIGVEAQKNKDKIVETKTRIINVMEDGEMVQKKVMVRTTKEQEVKTNQKQKGTIDADRVYPATKVSKVIYIDNDSDPFYDNESQVTYYQKDGMTYNFNPTNSGFDIIDGKNNSSFGTARISANRDVYILDTEDYSGIGYFKDNQFVIEYYDNEGTLIIEKFSDTEF